MTYLEMVKMAAAKNQESGASQHRGLLWGTGIGTAAGAGLGYGATRLTPKGKWLTNSVGKFFTGSKLRRGLTAGISAALLGLGTGALIDYLNNKNKTADETREV